MSARGRQVTKMSDSQMYALVGFGVLAIMAILAGATFGAVVAFFAWLMSNG